MSFQPRQGICVGVSALPARVRARRARLTCTERGSSEARVRARRLCASSALALRAGAVLKPKRAGRDGKAGQGSEHGGNGARGGVHGLADSDNAQKASGFHPQRAV